MRFQMPNFEAEERRARRAPRVIVRLGPPSNRRWIERRLCEGAMGLNVCREADGSPYAVGMVDSDAADGDIRLLGDTQELEKMAAIAREAQAGYRLALKRAWEKGTPLTVREVLDQITK